MSTGPKPWTPGLSIEHLPLPSPKKRWEFGFVSPWFGGARLITIQGWPALVLLGLTIFAIYTTGYLSGVQDAGGTP